MHINGEKTKILTVGVTDNQLPLKLKDQQLEEVESSGDLGSEVGQTTKVEREVMVRLNKAGTEYQTWRWKVFHSCNLSNTTKLRVLCTLVMPILLYGAETWPVTQQDIRKLRTFHMRCLWDILGVTLWEMRRNTDILRETGELPIEEQLRRKHLQWFGHVKRIYDECPQKQLLKCRPRRKKRPQGGTP